jgi:phage terminase small subunit
MRPITPKQQAFVDEYIIDLNGTQAAIRAGYSPKTAAMQASRLLTNVKVVEALSIAGKNREIRTYINADRVLREIGRLAFFDPRKLFKADGSPIPVNELDDDTAAAVGGLEVQEIWEGSGADRVFVGYVCSAMCS